METPKRRVKRRKETPKRRLHRRMETRNRRVQRRKETPKRRIQRRKETPKRRLHRRMETRNRRMQCKMETPKRRLHRRKETLRPSTFKRLRRILPNSRRTRAVWLASWPISSPKCRPWLQRWHKRRVNTAAQQWRRSKRQARWPNRPSAPKKLQRRNELKPPSSMSLLSCTQALLQRPMPKKRQSKVK